MDKSRPYLFQLFDKLENSESVEQSEDSISARVGQTSKMGIRGIEPKELGNKNVGKIVSNKPIVQENVQKPTIKTEDPGFKKFGNEESKRENQRANEEGQTKDVKNDSIKKMNKKEEIIQTEERENESQDQNDIFQSESIGLDMTVDSEAIKQFDYNESVEEED